MPTVRMLRAIEAMLNRTLQGYSKTSAKAIQEIVEATTAEQANQTEALRLALQQGPKGHTVGHYSSLITALATAGMFFASMKGLSTEEKERERDEEIKRIKTDLAAAEAKREKTRARAAYYKTRATIFQEATERKEKTGLWAALFGNGNNSVPLETLAKLRALYPLHLKMRTTSQPVFENYL